MGLFSRLLGECMCPLHSKDEAGYFDPLDTPGFKVPLKTSKRIFLSIYFFVDTRTASLKKINLIWKQCIASDVRLALYQFPRRWLIDHELKVPIPTRFIWHLNPGRVGFGRSTFSHFVRRDSSHLSKTGWGFSGRYDSTLLDDKTIICFH